MSDWAKNADNKQGVKQNEGWEKFLESTPNKQTPTLQTHTAILPPTHTHTYQKLSRLSGSSVDSVVCSFILNPLFPVLDTEDKTYSKAWRKPLSEMWPNIIIIQNTFRCFLKLTLLWSGSSSVVTIQITVLVHIRWLFISPHSKWETSKIPWPSVVQLLIIPFSPLVLPSYSYLIVQYFKNNFKI